MHHDRHGYRNLARRRDQTGYTVYPQVKTGVFEWCAVRLYEQSGGKLIYSQIYLLVTDCVDTVFLAVILVEVAQREQL